MTEDDAVALASRAVRWVARDKAQWIDGDVHRGGTEYHEIVNLHPAYPRTPKPRGEQIWPMDDGAYSALQALKASERGTKPHRKRGALTQDVIAILTKPMTWKEIFVALNGIDIDSTSWLSSKLQDMEAKGLIVRHGAKKWRLA